MRPKKDLTGMRFGRLTVCECVGKKASGHSEWVCKCDCGNVRVVDGTNLTRGHTTSCGCVQKKHGKAKTAIHRKWLTIKKNCCSEWNDFRIFYQWAIVNGYEDGARIAKKRISEQYSPMNCYVLSAGIVRSREYKRLLNIYRGMMRRTTNSKDDSFANYGGRGIKVCEEWASDFSLFFKWAVENGYSDELSVDRIDVDGDYCPTNCRWADGITQANNRRSNKKITYKGETHTQTQWLRLLGIIE